MRVYSVISGRRAWTVLIGAIFAGLTACAPAASDPVATSTPQATLAAINLGDCTIDSLSQWLGYSASNTQSFIDQLKQSVSITPTDVPETSRKLSAYRGVLATLIVPKCADSESKLVFSMMDGVQLGLTDFQLHRISDLKGVLATANQQYALIVQAQTLLKAALNLLYQQQQKH